MTLGGAALDHRGDVVEVTGADLLLVHLADTKRLARLLDQNPLE